MQLSDLSVRRPVLAMVVAILMCVVGIIAFMNLPVREFPDTDAPIVSVSTSYTGASANVIESRVTEVIENSLSGITGVQTITSNSSDGQSNVNVEFSPGRNIDDAANDVRDRVSGVVGSLPEDILPPRVQKADADAQPIMFIAVTKPDWTPLQLTDYVDRVIQDRFASIDGVSQVNIGGQARPSIRVWLDPEKLAAFHLTAGDVENAIRNQNVELPAGRLESLSQNMTVRISRPFVTPEQFAGLVIGRGADGYQIRVGDVAKVEQGRENPYNAFRFNGRLGVGLGIVRQSGANTLAVAEAARNLMEEMRPNLPKGMRMEVAVDDSVFISRAIENVYETLAEAAVLVVLVIFLFLGSVRATFIPAITVPICLLATCAAMWGLGLSLNLLTLLAFVLAIGLVVDDAIVVLENVYHRIEEGEDPLVAAFKGSRQVGFAIISTTATVCAVFVPVMFIAGQTGLLFRELAITMISAVAFSGFIALSLAPMLCSKLLRPAAAGGKGRMAAFVDDRFRALEQRYAKGLDRALRRPLLPLAGIAVFLGLSALAFMMLTSELAPAEDTGIVNVSLTAPEGTGYDQMLKYTLQMEKEVLPKVGGDAIRSILARVPGNFGGGDDFSSGRVQVFLKDWSERDKTTAQVAQEMTGLLATQPGVRGNATPRSGLGRGRATPISVVLAGSTYEDLAVARDRIIAAAADYPGILNLDSDFKETKPQLLLTINTQRAGDLGVSVQAIGSTLQSLLGSRRVSTYIDRGREYRVIVQAGREGRSEVGDLSKIYVRTRTGDQVPLSELVTPTESSTARSLPRYNKQRAISLDGGLAPGTSLGAALAFIEDTARQQPEVNSIGYRGESQSYREAGSSVWVVFAFTILVVFLLLSAQFESFIHPMVIVATVPLAVGGGAVGLFLMQNTINIYSQIGIVMLVGLAAKNGILIVEFANQLRDAGVAFDDAIRQAAARRLRPILMTSIATVMGAFPLVVMSGAGAASRASIGTVVVFGVSFATVITLFLIPILYSRVAKGTVSPQTVSRRLDSSMRPEPAE